MMRPAIELAAAASGGCPHAEELMAAGIARVVIASKDPSPKVSGQGEARLRAGGVRVESGLLADEADALCADYRRRL
jgi:diaminohydroxyphosphoribosylaminopyrimidine deaminase/5-amino-6-(5-phosphoribosylamino)uracil reductase